MHVRTKEMKHKALNKLIILL